MRHPEAVRWRAGDGAVDLLDQTLLPEREVRIQLETADEVAEAIRTMRVRGAPAIGVAAALGLAAEMRRASEDSSDGRSCRARFDRAAATLRATRPTAVNLGWALDRMRARLELELGESRRGAPDGASATREARATRAAAGNADGSPVARLAAALEREAVGILEEDREMCRRIGAHGLELIPDGGAGILTHCNAGALATAGMGTALAPVYEAAAAGRVLRVFADETRPLLQGSRLTAWELLRAGVDVTVVADSVAASLMTEGRIDLVLVGADRVAANGDVANKIGTYPLAVLAREHGIPFYVAAPVSTLDPATADGAAIPIEQRDADEVRRGFGRLTAPAEVRVYAPAFDVTPARLVTAIITDRGVLRPPYDAAIRSVTEEQT